MNNYELPAPISGMAPVYPVDTLEAHQGFLAYKNAANEEPGTTKLFDAVMDELPKDTVILEQGAGDGVNTLRFLRRGFRVIAAEPVEAARASFTREVVAAGYTVIVPEDAASWSLNNLKQGVVVLLPYGVSDTLPLPTGLEVGLQLDRHLLYHVPDNQWLSILQAGNKRVGKNGLYWATLKAGDTSDCDMLANFRQQRFDLSSVRPSITLPKGDRIVKELITHCQIQPSSFEHAVQIALFMLSDRACLGVLESDANAQMELPKRRTIAWQEFLAYVSDKLWQNGTVQWHHNHYHVLCGPEALVNRIRPN